MRLSSKRDGGYEAIQIKSNKVSTFGAAFAHGQSVSAGFDVSPFFRRNLPFPFCIALRSSRLSDNSSLNGRNHTWINSIMAIDESGSQTLDRGRALRVSLSKWVNERFPSFQDLLTAHDVARLTRRHRWVVAALTLLGRFPRRQRFHGRRIGWLRRDVLEWLTDDIGFVSCRATGASRPVRMTGRQICLPLGCSRACNARRRRHRCSRRRTRGRR